MGGITLLQLFAASEIGGSAPPSLLKATGERLPDGDDVLIAEPGQRPGPGPIS